MQFEPSGLGLLERKLTVYEMTLTELLNTRNIEKTRMKRTRRDTLEREPWEYEIISCESDHISTT